MTPLRRPERGHYILQIETPPIPWALRYGWTLIGLLLIVSLLAFKVL